MQALLVYKNAIPLVSAKLLGGTAVSFSLTWIGNDEGEVGIDLKRVGNRGIYKWNLSPILIGDRLSLVTGRVSSIDEPDEFFSNAGLEKLEKRSSSVHRKKRSPKRSRRIASLVCEIEQKKVCSVQLTTGNVFLAGFVWVGDRRGYSLIRMGPGGASPALKCPKIRFGDEICFEVLPL